jgi:hypothetical protein
MADYTDYLKRIETRCLIKLIDAQTRHQIDLREPLMQRRNVEQLQEQQAELFSRLLG